MGRGGARLNAGRPKKGIKLSTLIQQYCNEFMIEMLSNNDIKKRALREVQSLIEFEEFKEDYIYIIKSNDKYKIGYTANIKKRINDYTKHAGNIEVIYIYKGYNCFQLESKIHQLLSHRQYKGEWFDLCDSDILKIISYCSSLIN